METQFPRSSKSEAGGTQVIPGWSFRCDSSPPDIAVPKSPTERREKELFEFYRCSFPRIWSLIAGRNRFARRKTPSNTGDARLLLATRNYRETDALVTTNHLLLAIHRRRATSLLPFSQPISHFADSHSQRESQAGGRGGQARASGESASIEKRTRKFYSYWSLPRSCALKKKRFEPCSNSKASASGLSRELTSNHR